MYITVTMRSRDTEFHIQADDNLPIRAAAAALEEAFGTFGRNGPPKFFKSEMQSAVKSSYFTFRQADIHNGDILTSLERVNVARE